MSKIIEPMIIEAHEWLEEQKILNRLSYKKLGEPIGYSDTGIKKAFKNYTLNLIQIRKIAADLKLDQTKSNFSNFNIKLIEEESSKYKLRKPKTIEDKLDYIITTIDKMKCDVDFVKIGLASLIDDDIKK